MKALQERALLPSHAGSTPLRYFGDIDAPRLRIRTRDIMIPCWDGVEVYELQGGKQLLVCIVLPPFRPHRHIVAEGVECLRCTPSNMRRTLSRPRVYLIGEDEGHPFLSELPSFFYEVLVTEGEVLFYEKLKGPVIRQLEAKWGWERTRRQGDIFTYTLPFTRDELAWLELRARDKARAFFTCVKPKVERREAPDTGKWHDGVNVLGTRHRLVGDVTFLNERLWLAGVEEMRREYQRTCFIASGTLKAPNHAPIVLEGPHVIAQAMILRQGTYSAD